MRGVRCMRRYKTIRVTEDVHERLMLLLFELQPREKHRLSLNDVIKILLDHYERGCEK